MAHYSKGPSSSLTEADALRLASKIVSMPTVDTAKAQETFVLTQDVLQWFLDRWAEGGLAGGSGRAVAVGGRGGRPDRRTAAAAAAGSPSTASPGSKSDGQDRDGDGSSSTMDTSGAGNEAERGAAGAGYGMFKQVDGAARTIQRTWHGYRARKHFAELIASLAEEDIDIPALHSPRPTKKP